MSKLFLVLSYLGEARDQNIQCFKVLKMLRNMYEMGYNYFNVFSISQESVFSSMCQGPLKQMEGIALNGPGLW